MKTTFCLAFILLASLRPTPLLAELSVAEFGKFQLIGLIDRQSEEMELEGIAVIRDLSQQRSYILKAGQHIPGRHDLLVESIQRDGVWLKRQDLKTAFLSFQSGATEEPLAQLDIEVDDIEARARQLWQVFSQEQGDEPSSLAEQKRAVVTLQGVRERVERRHPQTTDRLEKACYDDDCPHEHLDHDH